MISSGYINLASFFAGFNTHEGFHHALVMLEEVLKQDKLCLGCVAFSLPEANHRQEITLDQIRLMGSKSDYDDPYYAQVIQNVLLKGGENLAAEEALQGAFLDHHYLLLNTGVRRKQTGWFLLKLSETADEELSLLLSKFFKKCLVGEEKYRELKKVEDLIYMDEVTGLFNQRKLVIDIENAIRVFEKTKETFSVIFMDIDHFKSVNDQYGHLVGTKVLEEVGRLLRDAFRENDLLYRYGGDEFVAIIPTIDKETAVRLSERILSTIKNNEFSIAPTNQCEPYVFNLSISIGVGIYPTDAQSKEDIINIADSMMYKAKKSGRGRVCMVSA